MQIKQVKYRLPFIGGNSKYESLPKFTYKESLFSNGNFTSAIVIIVVVVVVLLAAQCYEYSMRSSGKMRIRVLKI